MISLLLTLLTAAPSTPGLQAPTVAPSAQAPTAQERDEGTIEITYLANVGFLIASPKIKIVIDGFVRTPYRDYEALTDKAYRQITSGRAPFDGEVLGLVSHDHRDHFQARIGARFLAANGKAAVLAAPAIVESILGTAKDPNQIKNQVRPIALEPGYSQEMDLAPLDGRVRFMNLPHAGDPGSRTSNYAHLIRIGEVDILHIGDAEAKRELFTPLRLEQFDIDVALLPSWFFVGEEGTKIIDEVIRPDIAVACHVPPSDLGLFIETMRERNPHVVVFAERMETRRFVPASDENEAALVPVE